MTLAAALLVSAKNYGALSPYWDLFEKEMSMKTLSKSFLGGAMRLATLPFYLLYGIESILVGKRKAFGMVTQTVSLVPGLTGEWFRRAFLQWVTSMRLKNCCLSFGTTFSDPRVRIGEGAYLGKGCDIGYADIGRNCVIGSGVHILSGLNQHGFEHVEIPIKDQPGQFIKISIGEDTWIGNGAIIAADIGKKCVVGAGSVVVKPIADFAVAAGNPARVIRFRKISGPHE